MVAAEDFRQEYNLVLLGEYRRKQSLSLMVYDSEIVYFTAKKFID